MSNGQGSVLNWSSSSVPNKSNKECKRNAEFLLTNASVNTCTLQDGAHSLGAKARPLTHWQITLWSAQGKHNISQPMTNHTQFCTGKHTVPHPNLHRAYTASVNQTNHNSLCTGQTQRRSASDKSHSDRTFFSVFFNFSCAVLRLSFLLLVLMTSFVYISVFQFC